MAKKLKTKKAEAAEQQPVPKLLCRRHSIFFEEEFTNPAGAKIRIRKTGGSGAAPATYVVSVDGKRIDGFLELGNARKKAKALYHSVGAMA